jgi:hypothetical protein
VICETMTDLIMRYGIILYTLTCIMPLFLSPEDLNKDLNAEVMLQVTGLQPRKKNSGHQKFRRLLENTEFR